MASEVRPTVRTSFVITLILSGAAVAFSALIGLLGGPPAGNASERMVLLAIGAAPASVIVTATAMGLGLLLLAPPHTRKSGIALSVYSGSYLLGLGGGAALFVLVHGLD